MTFEFVYFAEIMLDFVDYMAGQHLGFCSRWGKIAVFAYQGGQALHAVQYNIYIVKFQGGGGANIQQGWANAPPSRPK